MSTKPRAGARRSTASQSDGTRVAAIDCGTNSLRLLIADVAPEARYVTDVVRRMEVVRLGQGVDRTGRLSDAALLRTFNMCDEFAAQIAKAGADRVRFVATSAVRDASNRAEFDAGIESRLGVIPEVISGDEEATLSFCGATGALGSRLHAEPMLVLDIGGGSTEFTLGDAEAGTVTQCCSVNIGCVRITERCLHGDPPTGAELAAAVQTIDAAITVAMNEIGFATGAATGVATGSATARSSVGTLVGLAGSVTTIAAFILGLDHYDPARTHGAVISTERIHTAVLDLAAMTTAQRQAIPTMHPGRADVIVGGGLVLDRVLKRAGVGSVVISEHDLLDGVALSLADSAG